MLNPKLERRSISSPLPLKERRGDQLAPAKKRAPFTHDRKNYKLAKALQMYQKVFVTNILKIGNIFPFICKIQCFNAPVSYTHLTLPTILLV